jgi:hypothetical protein
MGFIAAPIAMLTAKGFHLRKTGRFIIIAAQMHHLTAKPFGLFLKPELIGEGIGLFLFDFRDKKNLSPEETDKDLYSLITITIQ